MTHVVVMWINNTLIGAFTSREAAMNSVSLNGTDIVNLLDVPIIK